MSSNIENILTGGEVLYFVTGIGLLITMAIIAILAMLDALSEAEEKVER